ncbi:MAG TPA: histone deacetylase [Gemmatimonadales bacterium]|jgi:acetoin utilization deacetylase AcuC-like enzyme
MPSATRVVGLITHPDCLLHDNGPDHPESPRRIEAIRERLERDVVGAGLGEWVEAPLARDDDILRTHTESHLARLVGLDDLGGGWLDPDTHLGPGSLDAARRAAGAVVLAAEQALGGGGPSFCMTRPPGHHATPSRAMGFCLLSNVAIAAFAAIQRLGAERVLIIDWDVHHGNGTADCVRQEPRIRYVSMHQWPWYPGTGLAEDTGSGNLFHVPRPPGLPADRYVADLMAAVGDAVDGWAPSLVIHSAGFDCMKGDPLGGFTLEPEDLATITHQIASRAAGAGICSALEGGYDPARIAAGASAHVLALAGAGA